MLIRANSRVPISVVSGGVVSGEWSKPLTTHHSPLSRRGIATVWIIIAFIALFWVFVWATQVAVQRQRQQELKNAVDATSLAGVNAYVNDLWLTNTTNRQDTIITNSRTASQLYAQSNRVNGQPLVIDSNTNNFTDGELVLGTLANPFSHAFDASLNTQPDLYHPHLNAVRVALRRFGVAASATAFTDRDVYGFKIQGSLTVPLERDTISYGISPNMPVVPAIPVLPLAVLTDPYFPLSDDNTVNQARWAESNHNNSWEYRIMAGKGLNGDGSDAWMIGANSTLPQTGSDGIPEMLVTISEQGHQQADNGQVASVGVTTATDAIGQIQTGITYQQLQLPRHNPQLPAYNGELALNDGLSPNTPQNQLLLQQLSLTGSEIVSLGNALTAIQGQRRVWMLYSQVQQDNDVSAVLVHGFVVARVMNAHVTDIDDGSHKQLSVVIQPSMLVTATAVTDYTRRNFGPRSLFNPYACKVRLVE